MRADLGHERLAGFDAFPGQGQLLHVVARVTARAVAVHAADGRHAEICLQSLVRQSVGSHRRTDMTMWSTSRMAPAAGRADRDSGGLDIAELRHRSAAMKFVSVRGRRSTIVGLPPSAVPNFAKSLTVVARRGFSGAA